MSVNPLTIGGSGRELSDYGPDILIRLNEFRQLVAECPEFIGIPLFDEFDGEPVAR